MPSREYVGLASAVADLSAGLLGFAQRTDGAYTAEELLKCQAFIVFSHSEVENYLEKVARRIMSEAKTRWESTLFPDRVVATLLAFRRKDVTTPPVQIKTPSKRSDISIIVGESIALQEEIISENNGIKEFNISNLLCPLGVMKDDFEEALLIQLTNIGSKRGDLVHTQSKVSLPKIRDPFADEKHDIDDLVAELAKLDARLESLGLLSPT